MDAANDINCEQPWRTSVTEALFAAPLFSDARTVNHCLLLLPPMIYLTSWRRFSGSRRPELAPLEEKKRVFHTDRSGWKHSYEGFLKLFKYRANGDMLQHSPLLHWAILYRCMPKHCFKIVGFRLCLDQFWCQSRDFWSPIQIFKLDL